MNIYEDTDPEMVELISVVAQQPARQLAVAESGGSQPQGTSHNYAQRKVGDLNFALKMMAEVTMTMHLCLFLGTTATRWFWEEARFGLAECLAGLGKLGGG